MSTFNLINLQSLIDLSTRLNEYDNYNRILNTSALSLMGKLKFTKTFILVPDEKKYVVRNLRSIDKFNIDIFSIDDITYIDESISEQLHKQKINFCVPIKIDGILRFVLCFGNRMIEEELSNEEIRYISLVASITSSALKNASNLEELKNKQTETAGKNQLLRTILEISKDFNHFISKNEILKLLSFHLMGQLTITKFLIYEKENDIVTLKINKFPFEPDKKCVDILFSINQTTQLNTSEFCKDISNQYQDFEYAIPMKSKGLVKGIMIIGKKMNGSAFSNDNIVFLESLANISVAALENIRLIKDEIKKKQLETEMQYAREIQQQLLPKNIQSPANYDIFGISVPSKQVGGDYFDIITLSEYKTLLAIADVSGKGVAASLLMANIQAALKVSSENFVSILKTVDTLNRLIYTNTEADKFVTLIIGILDTKDNTFEYINAGHNPAIHISGDNYSLLKSSGLLLGFDIKCDDYEINKIHLNPSDTVFIYTDGVNEAENLQKQDFGTEKLINLLIQNNSKSSKQSIESIYQSLKDFTIGTDQYDDITMLAATRIN